MNVIIKVFINKVFISIVQVSINDTSLQLVWKIPGCAKTAWMSPTKRRHRKIFFENILICSTKERERDYETTLKLNETETEQDLKTTFAVAGEAQPTLKNKTPFNNVKKHLYVGYRFNKVDLIFAKISVYIPL